MEFRLPSGESLLDNGPILAMIGLAFGGSYDTIANFIGQYGTPGFLQYADAGCPDLLCFVAVREIMRDRRLRRDRQRLVSYPMVVFTIGLLETLTLNYVGNSRTPLGESSAQFWGHALALLAGTSLILSIILWHRRDDGAAAGTDEQSAAVLTEPVPEQPVLTEPVPEQPPAPWTLEDLIIYARQEWTEHADRGVRLSQGRFEMLLKGHPRGGAARGRVIKAMKAVRAEFELGKADEAVGR